MGALNMRFLCNMPMNSRKEDKKKPVLIAQNDIFVQL